MVDEAVEPRRVRGWAVNELSREDLELYGLDELEERIEALEAEITRIRVQMDKKKSVHSAADALFSFKGD